MAATMNPPDEVSVAVDGDAEPDSSATLISTLLFGLKHDSIERKTTVSF
jgi:hypothetical protein